MNKEKRLLTVIGDPNKINTWSNIPYFFLKTGHNLEFMDAGLPLQPEKLRVKRLFWNLLSWLQTKETGGFQYSPVFLKQLFAQVRVNVEQVEFISHFPLLPPSPWLDGWTVNYYIDATLQQNFEDYGFAAKVGQKVREAALKQERENYFQSKRIICMSRSTAKSVVEDYSILPSKVHIIPGGANLDEICMPTIEQLLNSIPPLTPLRLGFVGKDWQRKGLPYLLQIAEALHEQGITVEVVVVGPASKELPPHPLVRSLGFIDKSKDTQKFIKLVRSFHFGCLFSSVEAFGISNRECLRLGVPVLATRVGGIPDTVPEGLGFLFEPGSSPAAIADLLKSFVDNPSTYHSLRQRVVAHAEEFTWQKTVRNFIQVWQGSEDFLYDAIAAD